MKASSMCLVALMPMTSALAHAAEPQPMPVAPQDPSSTPDAPSSSTSEAPQHDGFMLRMNGGVAVLGAGVETDDEGADFGVAGVGSALSLQFGSTIRPNLALHLDLQAAGADETSTETERGFADRDVDGFGMVAGGVGVTYYWMPYDVAFSASLLYAQMGMEDEDGTTLKTDAAYVTKFDVLKQWPLYHDWGVGVAVSTFAGAGQGTDSAGEDFTVGMMGVSVNAVATYF